MSPESAAFPTRTRMRRRLAGILLLLGVLLLLVAATMSPRDFDPPAVDDPRTEDRANLLEQRFASELTRVRSDDGPWAIRIREEDVNAWLWTRLPAWVANRAGAGAFGAESMFQVGFHPDRVLLCTDRMAMAVLPAVDEGGLGLHASSGTAIGRLPVPVMFIDLLAGSVDLESLIDSLGQDPGGPVLRREGGAWRLPGRLPLVDGREVSVLEVRLEEGAVVLVLETVSAPSGDRTVDEAAP